MNVVAIVNVVGTANGYPSFQLLINWVSFLLNRLRGFVHFGKKKKIFVVFDLFLSLFEFFSLFNNQRAK